MLSFKASLRHLVQRPPHSSCLISFHHLSSDYAVAHFVVSADGEGVNDCGAESAPVQPPPRTTCGFRVCNGLKDEVWSEWYMYVQL